MNHFPRTAADGGESESCKPICELLGLDGLDSRDRSHGLG